MKLQIINKDGYGRTTEVNLIDGENKISLWGARIQAVRINPITPHDIITCNIQFALPEIDIIAVAGNPTKRQIYHAQNRAMMKKHGLGRIN